MPNDMRIPETGFYSPSGASMFGLPQEFTQAPTDPSQYYQQSVLGGGPAPGYGIQTDPFEQLVAIYHSSGDSPSFRAYAQQQGIDPQQVIQSTDQRIQDSNDWVGSKNMKGNLKHLAEAAALAGGLGLGALSLGGLGGAGAATGHGLATVGGADASFGAAASPSLGAFGASGIPLAAAPATGAAGIAAGAPLGSALGLPAGIAGATAAQAAAPAAGGVLSKILPALGQAAPLIVAGALGGSRDAGNATTSTTKEPPAFLTPYLPGAVQQAANLYGQGNYVAPVENSAIDYANKTLSGGFMGSNPYLDSTFNRAAGAVTNQVQSNFAGAGRNARGTDAAGLATDKYSDLASLIYGGDYEAERNRQQELVPQAGGLGAITNPGQSLDDYIARLSNLGGGYGTTSSQTPLTTNPLVGAVAGGNLGGAFGPWGTLGGAVLGGLYGG